MAAQIIRIGGKECGPDGAYVEGAAEAGGVQPRRLLYSYYTAGTGGVGPTILDTTFLLAGEDVLAYR